ncbi:Gfo/Idh/MocA family protein [Flavobacterium nackdongense]|uniref:Gfo/Idh/MocA family oxidoreductase n=1 Tax=Flavobacterium nackdongense TaxID=2547394 RepID=A0A4P6Y952_9FLAO|nr:Gfo/Idh/MocA family oxidoreductase [Flavobacterium nackdongense]QBN19501.1 Gfo/Idh/MocA family oxidoreductase [Flavobacterium nackdongense]
MKKLRLGIVGTGFITDYHYQAFRKNRNADIRGMCHTYQRNHPQYKQKQESLIEKCKGLEMRAYSDFDELVSDPHIDALIISSINSLHFEQIVAAINNRKHVLADKPVVTDVNQLEAIEQLSEEKGITIFPAHNFVYSKAIQKAKECIETGKIGQIIHASFISSHTISTEHIQGWRSDSELSKGGAMFDSGHHLLYQCLYLLGKPTKISSFKSRTVLKNMDCEDSMQLSVQFGNGAMAVLMQSWATDHAKMINGIRILGTYGSIVLTDALYFNDKKILKKNDYLESFMNLSKAFTDTILKKAPPLSDLNTVREILEITKKAYQIAETESVRII